MTWFCSWTKKFSVAVAMTACGTAAWAGGPFKPSSYGSTKESEADSRSNSMQSPYHMPPGYAGMPMMQPGMPMGGPGMPMGGPGMPMGQMGPMGPGGPMPQMGPMGPGGGMPMGPGGGMPPGMVQPAAYTMGQGMDPAMGGMPMGGPPMGGMPPNGYPGQFGEPSTQGSYCNDGQMGGCVCGGTGCNMCGGQFGRRLKLREKIFGHGEHCGYCGNVGCGLAGGCVGRARSAAYFAHSLLGRACGLIYNLTPYGEGGLATQRWYDVGVDAMFLGRSTDLRSVAVTSRGVGGPVVLSTGDVGLDNWEAGLRAQVNMQTGPGSNVELIYFGLNEWDDSATVTGNGDLYSYISGFGTTPLDGFDDTDRSVSQSLRYESTIHNGEFNFRRRWAEPTGFLQGSYLFGVRYIDIDEDLIYSTQGTNNDTFRANGLRFANVSTVTRNQLTGLQSGGDLWYNVVPGVKIGTELKGGVFSNNSELASLITSSSISNLGVPAGGFFINETDDDTRVAYMTEWSASVWYRLSYSWAVKAGYNILYLDNIATSAENVNTVPVALTMPRARAINLNNDSEVVYDGITVGAEYLW